MLFLVSYRLSPSSRSFWIEAAIWSLVTCWATLGEGEKGVGAGVEGNEAEAIPSSPPWRWDKESSIASGWRWWPGWGVAGLGVVAGAPGVASARSALSLGPGSRYLWQDPRLPGQWGSQLIRRRPSLPCSHRTSVRSANGKAWGGCRGGRGCRWSHWTCWACATSDGTIHIEGSKLETCSSVNIQISH